MSNVGRKLCIGTCSTLLVHYSPSPSHNIKQIHQLSVWPRKWLQYKVQLSLRPRGHKVEETKNNTETRLSGTKCRNKFRQQAPFDTFRARYVRWFPRKSDNVQSPLDDEADTTHTRPGVFGELRALWFLQNVLSVGYWGFKRAQAQRRARMHIQAGGASTVPGPASGKPKRDVR